MSKTEIEPTDRSVNLGLTELQNIGWIKSWSHWAGVWHIYTPAHQPDDPTVLSGPIQVACWIDGFIAGKGGL